MTTFETLYESTFITLDIKVGKRNSTVFPQSGPLFTFPFPLL